MNTLIEEKIRFYYGFIYLWHKENELLTIDIMESNNSKNYSELIKKYLNIVQNLPQPSKAELKEIYEIAELVRSGMLERNYCEKYLIDLCLGEIARKIFELREEVDLQPKKHNKTKVKTKEKYIYHSEEYWSEAIYAYQNFPNNNERNIGGRVVLIDTNWEFQKGSNLQQFINN